MVPQDWKEPGCGASSQAVGQSGQRGLRELSRERVTKMKSKTGEGDGEVFERGGQPVLHAREYFAPYTILSTLNPSVSQLP